VPSDDLAYNISPNGSINSLMESLQIKTLPKKSSRPHLWVSFFLFKVRIRPVHTIRHPTLPTKFPHLQP